MNSQTIIDSLKHYFVTQPVEKAWLFGSYSRGEESDESDVDILVALDRNAHLGLIGFSGMRCEIEDILKRDVDLVADGSLMPFAIDSVNRDKILIYERER